jgi:hypothetical protein
MRMDIYGSGSYTVNDEVWKVINFNMSLDVAGKYAHVNIIDEINSKMVKYIALPIHEVERSIKRSIFIL